MNDKKLFIFVSFFFILVSCLFFYPVFTRNEVPIPLNLLVSYYSPWKNDGYKFANKPIGFDVVRQMLPYQKFTKDSLTRLSLPLWNPYVFAGNPHIASFQPAFFYPATILFYLFSLENAWTLLVILQPILTGIFMYLYLQSLKLSKKASIFGAIAWAFSGWMICWWEESLVIVHSIIWLPLALLGSNFIWQKKKKLGFLLLTFALTLSLFAGFTQTTIYVFLTVFIWNISIFFQMKSSTPKANRLDSDLSRKPSFDAKPGFFHIDILVAAFFTTLLLTSVQWLPTLEAYRNSPRAATDAAYLFSGHLLPLTHLVTLFAPDFWGNPGTYNVFGNPGFYHERVIYLGLVPLLFAILAILSIRKKELTIWKYITLISFSMIFAIPTGWIWYVLHIPFLSSMQPTRIMMVTTFGVAVLSAYGMEEFVEKKHIHSLLKPLGIVISLAATAWAWVGWSKLLTIHCLQFVIPLPALFSKTFCPPPQTVVMDELVRYASISFRNLILPSGILLAIIFCLVFLKKNKTILFASLLSLHILSMFYFAQKYLYFSVRSNMYPELAVIQKAKQLAGNNRVWSYGNATIENNILSYFGIQTAEGYDAFFPKAYGELLGAIGTNKPINSQIARSDATLKHADEVERMTDNPRRLRMLSLLGVKYIIESKTGNDKDRQKMELRFPSNLFSIAWENDGWRIWEYKNTLPRAYVTSNVLVAKTNAEYTKYLFDPSVDFSNTIILDENPSNMLTKPGFGKPQSQALDGLPQSRSATITLYKPNTVVIQTTNDTPAMLYLSDSYYPGWVATIDGKPTKIYKADYAFRAVRVDQGTHEVIFTYRPMSFYWGIVLSMIGLGLGLFIMFRSRFLNLNSDNR
jgi:hypothetical protein